MSRRLHELGLAELEKKVRYSRVWMMVLGMLFMVTFLVSWILGYAVDPLFGCFFIMVFIGVLLVICCLDFLQTYFVWLLKLRFDKGDDGKDSG
jgi:uncharacterized membrane protein YhaH (DUF805 family)